MVKLFTMLLLVLGWGLGEATASKLYPDNPETWLFIKACFSGTPAGIFWAYTEFNQGRSTPP